MLIYMTKHSKDKWSLENERDLVMGSVTRLTGSFHLHFAGTDNTYPTLGALKLKLRLLGHTIVERHFNPKGS